ncbi:hypothetical protein HZU75_14510 [Chitinibacter fontanus]|uniref:Type I restriction endonuclease subunit M n=1 Tax=Chitinibacter fontanus TaxID=1737446 RepID=A0A7D5Z9P7_9NEIS|nr:hypothetical protein [Chitinibacter fontanus]QLI82642.1 hypothetical protein HZU75_14510 [Chitinibacter fontanus]
MTRLSHALFSLGQTVATPGALAALDEAAINALALLRRHQTGDWGDLPPEDWESNQQAVECGWRILSNYPLTTGERIWIITEADRSVTTLLLPEEY